MLRSRPFWLFVAAPIGAILTATTGLRSLESYQSACDAARNLQRCRELSQQIQRLHEAPARAALLETSSFELIRQVEQSASAAEIPAKNLLRIDTQPGRRLKDSAYLEQSTHVEMQAVSMPQLSTFLSEITAGASGLEATSLRLTAPHTEPRDGVPDLWAAEVTLTHLVFSPQSRRSRS